MSKLYAAYEFEGHDVVDGLHCTHKFIGEDHDLGNLTALLEPYFMAKPFRPFVADFDEPVTWAHSGKEFHVLCTHAPYEFHLELWKILFNRFGDTFGQWRPHVTFPVPRITPAKFNVVDYVAISDKRVVWRASQMTHSG